MKKFFFILCLFGAVTSANAVVIDNGIYNTDTDTGLQWLDFTATNGLQYSDALVASTGIDGGGWRYATNAEVQNLFNIMFEGYYSNQFSTGISRTDYPDVYTGHQEDADNFQAIFGSYASNASHCDSCHYTLMQFGADDPTVPQAMGVRNIDYTVDSGFQDFSMIYGLDYVDGGYGEYEYNAYASFLVRDTASVPEASTLMLLGIGLLGLVFSRRKHS